jgi:pentatricopeptide repeat protein
VLHLMDEAGVAPSTSLYNVAINACAKKKEWRAALRVFERMQQDEVAPDTVTFNTLLKACGMAHKWAIAEGVYNQMDAFQGD